MSYNDTQQRKGSNFGIATPITTHNRHNKKTLQNYDDDTNKLLTQKMTGPQYIYHTNLYADDLTRMRKSLQGQKRWVYTTVGAATTPLKAATCTDKKEHICKDGINLIQCQEFFKSNINFVSSPLDKMLLELENQGLNENGNFTGPKALPTNVNGFRATTNVNSEFVCSPKAISTRVMSSLYGGLAEAKIHGKLKGSYVHIDTLNQPFHSYENICTAILRWLLVPPIFNALASDVVMIMPGDWPAQELERNIIQQGWLKSPEYLAQLFQSANKDLYDKLHKWISSEYSLTEDIEIQKQIGNAAMNIWTELGPLHIRINPPKDIFKKWYDILYNPLYHSVHGNTMPINPHMREIIFYTEVLFAAWLKIRDEALSLLLPLIERFDIASYIWLIESSMALPCWSYDVFFKNALMDQYYNLLAYSSLEAIMKKRKHYKYALPRKIWHYIHLKKSFPDLFDILCRTRTADEQIVEMANMLAAKIIKHDKDQALDKHTIDHIKLNMGAEQSAKNHRLLSEILPQYNLTRGCGGDMQKFIEAAVVIHKNLIQKMLNSLNVPKRLNATSFKITVEAWGPVLNTRKQLQKHKKDNKNKAKHLQTKLPPVPTSSVSFDCRHYGAPSWALSIINAPDSVEKNAIGCHQNNCKRIVSATNEITSSKCGHLICKQCLEDNNNNCHLCMNSFISSLVPILSHIKTESTTVKSWEEFKSKQTMADANDAEDDSDDDADDDDDDDTEINQIPTVPTVPNIIENIKKELIELKNKEKSKK